MSDYRVASRYARALYSAASRENIVDSVESDLQGICAVIDHSADLQRFLGNPNTAREDRERMYTKLFSDRTTALTMSLLRLLITKGRENCIHEIRDEFHRLKLVAGNKITVVVESAQELSDAQKNAILDKVLKATGRQPEAEYHLVPELLGGVKVTYANQVIDGTVLGSLKKMREHIINDVLKQA